LIQYTLAIDRTDDSVAHLYDPLHPAVLQLIAMTIAGAEKAGIPVSVCGEMAGDVHLTRLLLGLGIREFSMHPAHIPAVKQQGAQIRSTLYTGVAQKMLRTQEPERLQQLLAKLNA